ncbi:MAG: tetratricopeptide repeat protein [Deltaproteobacteria bacterium]|nr:tetratricopeptide repeat protein [Deltaproteobacteria bacterium]
MEKCKFKDCKEFAHKNSFCDAHYQEIVSTIKMDDDLFDHTRAPVNPGVSPALYMQTLALKFGKLFGSVINAYQKFFKVTIEDASFILEKRAEISFRKKEYDKVVQKLEKVVKYKVDDANVVFKLGHAYSKVGRFAEAIKCFKRVLELDPNNKEALFYLGRAYAREAKYDQAVKTLQQLVTLDPLHLGGHYRLGIVYDKIKKYDEAIKSFREAIKINPDVAKIHQSLGMSLESKGEHDEAVKCFKKAIDLGED